MQDVTLLVDHHNDMRLDIEDMSYEASIHGFGVVFSYQCGLDMRSRILNSLVTLENFNLLTLWSWKTGASCIRGADWQSKHRFVRGNDYKSNEDKNLFITTY